MARTASTPVGHGCGVHRAGLRGAGTGAIRNPPGAGRSRGEAGKRRPVPGYPEGSDEGHSEGRRAGHHGPGNPQPAKRIAIFEKIDCL